MITWKVQGGERHVFNILPFTRIIFPSFHNIKVLLFEQDEILGIHISLLSLLQALRLLMNIPDFWIPLNAMLTICGVVNGVSVAAVYCTQLSIRLYNISIGRFTS